MTVTMAAEVLAWSQETDPDEIVPYPTGPHKRWMYAAWLALAGLLLGAVIAGVLMLVHTDQRPASPPVTGGGATPDAPITMPVVPAIPDEPDVHPKDTSPDTLFLSTLHTGTTGWNDPAATYIEWAHWVCQSVTSGRSIPDTVLLLSVTPPTRWPAAASRFYVATAMKAYCPGSVG